MIESKSDSYCDKVKWFDEENSVLKWRIVELDIINKVNEEKGYEF